MNIIVLDLEWNGAYSRRKKGYLNEIIEIGAVKCDENLNILDTFSCFIKPQLTKKLSSIISDLTNITDDKLDDGIAFMRAVSLFRKWSKNSVILAWGPSDVQALIENCRYFGGVQDVPFLSFYADLQLFTEKRLGLDTSRQIGLEKAAEILNIPTDSLNLHRALDDSLLAVKVLKEIYDPAALAEVTTECNDDFYNKMTFKTSYICDLHNPALDPKSLKFICPKCSANCRRVSNWDLKNKSFRAEFICKECGYNFGGRLILKQKYEGISVNKKTFPIPIIEKPREAIPQKLNNMQLGIAENGVGLLKFTDFEYENLAHCFSTRIGGVSKNEFASINLGFGRGDSNDNVRQNYKLVADALSISQESFTAGNQDHNVNIRRVGTENIGTGIWKPKDMDSIDGLCTNDAGVSLVIYCADCVPLYFYDEKNYAIGLAHAGWKGTAAGMASAMIKKMTEEFGSSPENIKAAIGPSIGPESFEVDEPVAKIFSDLSHSDKFVKDIGEGKFLVDLWECNRTVLVDAGVPLKNIIIGGVCTFKESDLLFSHRKTLGERGSNAAILTLLK